MQIGVHMPANANAAIVRDERCAVRDSHVITQVDQERLRPKVDPARKTNPFADRPELEQPDSIELCRASEAQLPYQAPPRYAP
jgi:hypothetical protein